jgi:hypothetical protein
MTGQHFRFAKRLAGLRRPILDGPLEVILGTRRPLPVGNTAAGCLPNDSIAKSHRRQPVLRRDTGPSAISAADLPSRLIAAGATNVYIYDDLQDKAHWPDQFSKLASAISSSQLGPRRVHPLAAYQPATSRRRSTRCWAKMLFSLPSRVAETQHSQQIENGQGGSRQKVGNGQSFVDGRSAQRLSNGGGHCRRRVSRS